MGRRLAIGYAAGCYLAGVAVCLYAAGFVADVLVPVSLDRGASDSPTAALAGNAALLVLFAVQHSGMARPRFKRWWTQYVPEPIERSTYVLASSAALALLMGLWKPVLTVVWTVEAPWSRLLSACAIGGVLLIAVASVQIDHAELLGLRQALRPDLPPVPFQTPGLYRVVRHPLMLGLLLAFWAAPRMTVGRLEFNLGMTAYILVALRLEERDLLTRFGEKYADYRRRVPGLIPWPVRRAAEGVAR